MTTENASGWIARGIEARRRTKYVIGGFIAALGGIAVVVGLLTQPLDTIEGFGFPLGGVVLLGIAGLLVREGHRVDAHVARTWLRDAPERIAWVYVWTARDGQELILVRDDKARAMVPLASPEDAVAAMAELRERLPRCRFGYRREWHAELG